MRLHSRAGSHSTVHRDSNSEACTARALSGRQVRRQAGWRRPLLCSYSKYLFFSWSRQRPNDRLTFDHRARCVEGPALQCATWGNAVEQHSCVGQAAECTPQEFSARAGNNSGSYRIKSQGPPGSRVCTSTVRSAQLVARRWTLLKVSQHSPSPLRGLTARCLRAHSLKPLFSPPGAGINGNVCGTHASKPHEMGAYLSRCATALHVPRALASADNCTQPRCCQARRQVLQSQAVEDCWSLLQLSCQGAEAGTRPQISDCMWRCCPTSFRGGWGEGLV